LEDRTGGDSELSPEGSLYPNLLNKFFQDELKYYPDKKQIKVFTSTLKRALQTSKAIDFGSSPIILQNLNEISSGIFDCMTYQEIKTQNPAEYKLRAQYKLSYRYPMGESYIDLIQRLEPIIFEIERSRHPIIIISH
jgi:broad specificity phosphatase PhoE